MAKSKLRGSQFSGVEIDYLGGIESVDTGETITGSCTLFNATDTRGNAITIVIDAGMHQGGKDEYEKNKSIDSRVLDADYLIITHAHIDHIGKIPLLVKEGFRGKIYMSSITKQIAIESLKDSASVMAKEHQEALRYNKRVGPILKSIVQLSEIEEKLSQNGFKKGDQKKLVSRKDRILQKYPEGLLDKFREKYLFITHESQIADVMLPVNEPLYSQDDVLSLVNKISILDAGEETKLELGKAGKVQDTPDQGTMREVLLGFHNAGHMAGSIQAQISIRVAGIINNGRGKPSKEEVTTKNYLFSGDLGRGDSGNLSGKPTGSPHRFDYAQIESTYALRNHPEREKGQRELLRIIDEAPGKVIIPAFAVQRSQEILLLLLQHLQKNILPQIEKKRQELKNKDLSSAERDEIRREIRALDLNIVLDSPLATKMKDIYVNAVGGDFSLLDPNVQKEVFGREMITIMKERNDYKKLYEGDKRSERHVIVSSGGMCQGGAVLSHILPNIGNPYSTIAMVGYTPEGTLGHDIKNRSEVIIEGIVYQKRANVHDIGGFSGHIGHDEILEYLQNDVRKSATCVIALTHGGDNRCGLASEIKVGKKGEVLVPKNGDSIKLPFTGGRK